VHSAWKGHPRNGTLDPTHSLCCYVAGTDDSEQMVHHLTLIRQAGTQLNLPWMDGRLSCPDMLLYCTAAGTNYSE